MGYSRMDSNFDIIWKQIYSYDSLNSDDDINFRNQIFRYSLINNSLAKNISSAFTYIGKKQ